MQCVGHGSAAAVQHCSSLADAHYFKKMKTFDAGVILALFRGPLHLHFHHSLL